MEIDVQTVRKAIDGDADAFVSLYGNMYKAMYRYAYFLLGRSADAEDAVADTVVDAWEGIGALRVPEAFSVWVYRILSAKCKRRRAAYSEEGPEVPPDLSGGSFDSTEETLSLLSGLDETDRNIILLHVIAGFKTREIAEMLDMRASTVRSRENRALKKLRSQMS